TQTAGREPFGVENRLCQAVASAGQCVKATSRTSAGSSSSQAMICICRSRGGAAPAPRGTGPDTRDAMAASRGVEATVRAPTSAAIAVPARSAPVCAQDAVGLALRVLHRIGWRLRTGERGLQPVVERFRHALIL